MIRIKYIIISIIILCAGAQSIAQQDLMQKYAHYRQRLLNDFIVVSPQVEAYGTNIPAIDRKTNDKGETTWITWSDANSNFNNYIIMLSTEIRLLQMNDAAYQQSLKELVFTLLAIERLDLYSEYNVRIFYDKKRLINGDSTAAFIEYPDDINGFLLRDDVSTGFWWTHYRHFNASSPDIADNHYGPDRFKSLDKRGVLPFREMSQDNIVRMLEALAVMKGMLDVEDVSMLEPEWLNTMIPDYLEAQGIWIDDSVDFDRWAADICDRLVRHMQQPFPAKEMAYKLFWSMGRRVNLPFPAILSTRWYIMNPVLQRPVLEGNGTDFGVFMNAYGMAELAHAITGKDTYHFDASDGLLMENIFRMSLFKELPLPFINAGIQIPGLIDDYMIRSLAAAANINGEQLPVFELLRDKRPKYTYEHYPLINYLLYTEQVKPYYPKGCSEWITDSVWYRELLEKAPPGGPFSDTTKKGYSVDWCTSSRLIWPTDKPTIAARYNYDFAGLDYMALYNLYRLVYCPDGYHLSVTQRKVSKSYPAYTGPSYLNVNKKYLIHAPIQQDE